MKNGSLVRLMVGACWVVSVAPVRADEAESLYRDRDYSAAYQAYGERLQREVTNLDKLEYGAGTAAYKAGNYGPAAEHLGRAILSEDEELRGKAYYNLGNTLFQLGKASEDAEAIVNLWESAVDHFGEAEALGGSVASNARHNREIVEKHLAALEEQQQQQQQEQQEGEKEQAQDGEEQGQQDGQEQQDQEQQDGQEESGQQEQEQQSGQDQQEQQQGQGQEEQQQDGQKQEEGGQPENGQQKQEGQEGDPASEGQEGDAQQSAGSEGEEEGNEGERLGEKEGQEGELKRAGDAGAKGDEAQEVSAYELTPDGKLSEAAARALLESLEGQEVKAPYEIRRSRQRQRVIRDW